MTEETFDVIWNGDVQNEWRGLLNVTPHPTLPAPKLSTLEMNARQSKYPIPHPAEFGGWIFGRPKGVKDRTPRRSRDRRHRTQGELSDMRTRLEAV